MWIKKTKLVALFIFIFTFLSGIIYFMNTNRFPSRPLIVWSRFEPTSADPMDYDQLVHHQTFRSVFSSLVSVYKLGEISPQIAKSWETNEDKTEWVLEIDEKWTFDNDEKVTTKDVLKSLTRLILLKNKQNSKSGLLEYLIDSEKVVNLESEFSGLKISSSKIYFKFNRPMPAFLEKISFGLYSIIHPSLYDKNGVWKKDQKLIASGAYRVTKWEKGIFNLELRENHYLNLKKYLLKSIHFNFSKKLSEIRKSDLMFREKLNPVIDKTEWEFHTLRANNSITYIQVMNWNDRKNSFGSRSFRTKIRDLYYDAMEKEGVEVTRSFFPVSIENVSTFTSGKIEILDLKGADLKTQPFFIDQDLKAQGIIELGLRFKTAFERMAKSLNANPVINEYPERIEDEKKVFDFQFLGTSLLIDEPDEDIKFMFLSKQGIQLPDESGEISELLNNEKIDVQAVNQKLWEQAIIWPVRHYSTGIWLKKSSKIDLSELNISLHPIDFQYIKSAE